MTIFDAKAKAAVLTPPPRPLSASTSKRTDVLDLIARAAVVQTYAQSRRIGFEHARTVIAKRHPRYDEEPTRFVCRAAVSPATTQEEGWATELVAAQGADLIAALMPRSAFAQLAAQGMHLTFSNGVILVPDFIPSTAGVFVREGEPIPVIQGQATGQMLTRKKMACIVTYTGDMSEAAIVTMEGLLRARIQESTGVTLDSILLDDHPADDARPAGLLNGGVEVFPAGSMQADLQLLAEGLFAAAGHVVRAPVLVMNTAQAFAAKLQLNREFVPLVVSASMDPGTVAMLDASDFACAGGQVPRFEVGREAALHFEDTIPDHLSSGVPVRSLYQEELLGLRMIFDVDWLLRRPGVVCYMRGVQWHLGGP